MPSSSAATREAKPLTRFASLNNLRVPPHRFWQSPSACAGCVPQLHLQAGRMRGRCVQRPPAGPRAAHEVLSRCVQSFGPLPALRVIGVHQLRRLQQVPIAEFEHCRSRICGQAAAPGQVGRLRPVESCVWSLLRDHAMNAACRCCAVSLVGLPSSTSTNHCMRHLPNNARHQKFAAPRGERQGSLFEGR